MRQYNCKVKANKFIDATQEILKSYQVRECKRSRIKLTTEQLHTLEMCFWENSHPSAKIKESLSYALQIPLKNLQIWFQNRRAKRKSEKDALKIKHDKRIAMEEQVWLQEMQEKHTENPEHLYKTIYNDYYIRQYYPQESNGSVYLSDAYNRSSKQEDQRVSDYLTDEQYEE